MKSNSHSTAPTVCCSSNTLQVSFVSIQVCKYIYISLFLYIYISLFMYMYISLFMYIYISLCIHAPGRSSAAAVCCCNALSQHTATRCRTLQHSASHILQHTATRRNILHHTAAHCSTRQHTAANVCCSSNTLQVSFVGVQVFMYTCIGVFKHTPETCLYVHMY